MKKIFILPLLLFSVSLAGCQSGTKNTNTPATDSAPKQQVQKLNIVTSFYPLTFFTEQITGGKANVINLAGNNEVHDFRPSPQDIIQLNNADLVVFQGAGLEPWADDMIPQLQEKSIPTVEVSHDIDLHKMEEHEDEHAEEEEEDEEHEEEHHHGEFDPHTWLDPVLAQQMVNSIVAKINEIDPKNSTFYTQNANTVNKKLQAFDDQYTKTFTHCTHNQAIISHDAFGYVARRYNLDLHPIAGISPHDEPSAALLAELNKEAKAGGVSYILTEENNVKQFAQTLARETGLTMLPVNPLETDSEEFFTGYTKNFNSFKTALGCQ